MQRAAIRAMEAYTRDVGGYQCLYADTLQTREEFRRMFHHELYDKMRVKVCWGGVWLAPTRGGEGRDLFSKTPDISFGPSPY